MRLRSDDFELDRAYLTAEFLRWPEAADIMDRAEERGEFLQPWVLARDAELRAALGQSDRYLRLAARLADFDGRNSPDPFEIARTLGLVKNDLVSPDRLIEIARAAIAVNPSAVWRRMPLGLAYYRAGRFREAIDHLAAPELESEHLAPSIRALARWRLGEKDAAREQLALADEKFESWCRERTSGRGTAWLNWWFDGFMLVVLRREAHELIDGHAPDDRAALASVRAAMGKLIDDRDSPTWAYDLALRLEPGNVPFRNARAARLIELGRFAEAEPQLAAMVEGKAKEPRAWVERGMLLAGAGRPDRAAADFARALELIPQDLNPFHARSILCAEMAAQPAAFDRLLGLRQSDALLWYTRACDHLIQGSPKAAVADFVRGGEPPATTEFAVMYAAALLLAGDQQGYARYVSQQADVHGNADETVTTYILTRAAMLAGRPPVPPHRMLEWASLALKREPRVAWYAHAKGLAAFRAGDMQTARAALEESEQLAWNEARVLNQAALSLIDLREGHVDTARTRFDEARESLDLAPTIRPASGKIQLLDWLEFQVLRPQIEGPIFDRVFPVDPFVR